MSTTAGNNGNASASSCIVLPGTFKSMVHPNTTGDISVTINGISCLNELLKDSRSIAPPTPPGRSNSSSMNNNNGTLRFDDVSAKVQLTYRAQTHSSLQDMMVATPRRLAIPCRGKVSISSKSNNSSPSSSEGALPFASAAATPNTPPSSASVDNSKNFIKQYDMMFIQSDFQPGQPFFSGTHLNL
jgi:hypothetical protein